MSKKMVFSEDKKYDGKFLYLKGVVYDVEDNMVDRWLKRGGKIVDAASIKEEVPAPPPHDEIPEDVIPTEEVPPEEPEMVEEEVKPSGKKKNNKGK